MRKRLAAIAWHIEVAECIAQSGLGAGTLYGQRACCLRCGGKTWICTSKPPPELWPTIAGRRSRTKIFKERTQRCSFRPCTNGRQRNRHQLGPDTTIFQGPDGNSGNTFLAAVICPRKRRPEGICPCHASKRPKWQRQPSNRRRNLLGQCRLGEQEKMENPGEEPGFLPSKKNFGGASRTTAHDDKCTRSRRRGERAVLSLVGKRPTAHSTQQSFECSRANCALDEGHRRLLPLEHQALASVHHH